MLRSNLVDALNQRRDNDVAVAVPLESGGTTVLNLRGIRYDDHLDQIQLVTEEHRNVPEMSDERFESVEEIEARLQRETDARYDELRAHLREVHCNEAAPNLPNLEVGTQHWEEHNLPGGLRNHSQPEHLHVWLDGNTALVGPEAAQLLAEALTQPRDTFVSRERPIRLLGTEPEPATEEREQPNEYDEGHLRALREGSQPLPVPNDRPGAHDLLDGAIAALVRRRAEALRFAGQTLEADAVTRTLGDVGRLVVARRALGLTRYGSLLQAGNGRDSLRDAIEEVVDLAAYLVTWREARDEALALLRELLDDRALGEDPVLREKIDRVVHLLAGEGEVSGG